MPEMSNIEYQPILAEIANEIHSKVADSLSKSVRIGIPDFNTFCDKMGIKGKSTERIVDDLNQLQLKLRMMYAVIHYNHVMVTSIPDVIYNNEYCEEAILTDRSKMSF